MLDYYSFFAILCFNEILQANDWNDKKRDELNLMKNGKFQTLQTNSRKSAQQSNGNEKNAGEMWFALLFERCCWHSSLFNKNDGENQQGEV